MTTYFTSDLHFYHNKIIEYCNRPFTCVSSMTTALIKNYNSVVKPNDTVWILGDLMLATQVEFVKHILDRMHGFKFLIKGNHDRMSNKEYKEAGFMNVYKQHWFKGVLFVHDPADNYFDCPCIAGHVHNLWLIKNKTINVSVENWDYKPVSWETIQEVMRDQWK